MAATAKRLPTLAEESRINKGKGRLRKNTFVEVFPDLDDMGEAVRLVTIREATIQAKKFDNPFSKMIVDSKPGKKFKDAQYRIVTTFLDVEEMAKAAQAVARELYKVTRKKTGKGRKSIEVWTIDHFDTAKDGGRWKANNAPNKSINFYIKIAENLKPGGAIVIAGPMVDYGRKLYWKPDGVGGAGQPKNTITTKIFGYKDSDGNQVNVRKRRTKNEHDIVVGRMKRKFRGAYVTGRWVRSRSVGSSKAPDRWPGIAIGNPANRRT